MMNMGYVDEVLFGYEVVERLPSLAAEWLEKAKAAAAALDEPQMKGAVDVEDAVQAKLL